MPSSTLPPTAVAAITTTTAAATATTASKLFVATSINTHVQHAADIENHERERELERENKSKEQITKDKNAQESWSQEVLLAGRLVS